VEAGCVPEEWDGAQCAGLLPFCCHSGTACSLPWASHPVGASMELLWGPRLWHY